MRSEKLPSGPEPAAAIGNLKSQLKPHVDGTIAANHAINPDSSDYVLSSRLGG